ncbi:DUF6701 domain-containing protein [Aeromonas veronii]|uniref:DUF6701 domain-containing protein n=1 Tax=Aeromonas veronii TaxID=654 RepID=UPI0015FF66E1|nr:DUF6701 domain-containing protein [Aeromonas veronii]
MKTRKSIWGFILLTIMLGSASAQGGDQCTAVFPFPVQSHMTPGLLGMNNESKITSLSVGTNYPFLGKSIQPNANCNNGGYWNGGTWVSNCSISGTLASPLKNVDFINDPDNFPTNSESFPAYGSQNDLLCDGATFPVAGDYRNASWGGNNCVATLTSGKTYRFDTLSLVEGAVLNLNGATVYAKKLTIKNDYNSGFTGPGNLHVNELTVTGNGKLNDARVTVYSSLEVSGNGNTGGALFQPRYIENVIMDVAPSDQRVLMAAGNWSIRNLGMKSNSNMTFLGQSTLSVYGLRMEGQGRITAAGSRSDLTLQLHQTLEMIGNATINGYLQARYLNTFKRQSTSNINLYFSGGSHWIDKLELGHNDKLFFDSGSATQFYIKNGLVLSDQMEVNAEGKANNLMLYNFGHVAMSGNTKLNAILYVKGGNLTMDSEAKLTGAVSAVNVTMTGNSKVIHEPFGGDWPDICPFFNCKDIFTDPPTGGATMTPPPGVLQPPLGDLVCNIDGTVTRCTGHGSNSFTPGDHDFNNGSIGNQAQIIATGVTARLYFNNLDLNNARLNIRNRPENLFIYVKGDLSITGQNEINAILYVAGNIQMAGNAKLTGALAAGGNIDISGNRNYFFDQNAVEKVDLGGTSCGGESGGIKVDHFEFSHSGQGMTCQPEEITVKACANADCSQLMSETVTAALTPHPITNGGWSSGSGLNNVNNGIVTITNGVTKVMLSNYSANSITMGVSSSTPPLRPQSDTLCRSGSLGPAKQYCTLPFADAALRFNVPTFYAGTSGVTSIRAIKSNDAGATKVCVPLLTGDQTLQFASSKVVSEASGAVPMVNSTAIAPSGNVKVAFNSDGVGQLTVQYPDAGVLRLDATFQKNDVTGTLKLTGSDTVAVIPKAIALQAQGQSGCSGSNDNTYAACPVYRKAGESFTLQARALNEQDQLTPGFATSNKAISWALLAPAAGGTGTFSPTAISLANGVANNVVANWSEVGVIQLGVSNFVPYPAYQDESPQLETVQRWSSPIGRFVPWDYSLSNGFITPACNAYTYMSQPFASGFVITARNLQQGTTQNYQGAFAKGVAQMVAANALDGVDRSGRITQAPTLSWASGIASVNQQSPFGLNTRFDRAASPEAPFATLSFGIKVDDKDGGNTRLAMMNMNAGVVGDCSKSGQGCNAVQLGAQKLLYGRLLAGKDRGVDSANLPLKLLMQRFDLGGWVINDEDNCTQLSLANSGFDPLPAVEPKDPDRKIGFNSVTSSYEVTGKVPPLLTKPYSSTLTLSGQTVPASSARAKQGEIIFHFGAPNVAVRIPYKVDLAKQPSSPLWLSDPATANDGNLQGEAIFGSSRGNDRIIYRREVLQ